MTENVIAPEKAALRKRLRTDRQAHVAALPDAVRALVFSRPPAAALARVPSGSTIGLYHAGRSEAPTLGYAKWFHENGHPLALPSFMDAGSAMAFRSWCDPYDEHELETGPFAIRQPVSSAPSVIPDVLFVPLIGFTAAGHRLGQGGGHYDRWLEARPEVPAIGLGWDCQRVEALPTEVHDRRLAMIVTPTRVYAGEG